jgi:hypothetical protein
MEALLATRWRCNPSVTAVLLVAAMVGGGLAVAVPGSFSAAAHAATSASAVPSVSVALAAESPSWSPTELQAAATVPAPYTEPGMGLAGATYLGAPSLATAADHTGSINILITLAFSNESKLNTLLQELSNPASPEYHHYLTATEFDSEFGPAPSVYNSLVQYLTSFGVTGLTTYPDRVTVSFEATPLQVTAMFHTSLVSYVTASGEAYYAPASAPLIPAPLAPYVVDLEGLSDYSQYLNHLAPLASVNVPASALSTHTTRGGAMPAGVPSAPSSAASHVSPGGASNPFATTTVTSNGLTATFDQPVNLNLSGKTGKTCDTTTCGEIVQAPDLQVTYNETGLLQKYGYPVNATVAALLWSDTICHANTGTCENDGYYNYYCSTLTTGDAAWDFFMPDVTSFWNYSIPAGEPMPTAYSMAESSFTYAYPAGSQGYSASCDDGAAEDENTLDVSMLGSMAPGANVFQVFGGSSSTTAIDTAFADVLSPTTAEFSTDGGFDTAAAIAKLENVSVITNSWTTTGTLPAAWTTDLKTAAARGITVLGATGDSGTTLEPPSEIANNAYGTVAVGGTTAAINRTTLLRGPAHLAVSTAPYYGVGTGEIGWYEPAGTVDGFTTTYGGTGGVATSTTYYRATWFNASADAVGVANAVRSGNYRAAPDIAAISNDTMLDLDQGSTSLNMTCWVATNCTKISKLSVGTTSGSAPTVEASYFIGTSIAVQVTGGMVAVMDYALHAQHQGWLGFLDPTAYAMGQKQYAGQLTLQPLYDITMYTDAGGLVADYEAATGYDLATGWGVLDAGNYTQNTMTYNVTFTETGLPSGTSWSVTVTPTLGDANCTVSGSSCSNSATRSSTGTTIVFAETYGRYTYTVASSNNLYSAPGGSFKVCGKPVAASVTFSSVTYLVTFTEAGLPSGTEWRVNVTGEPSLHSTGTTISTAQPNGSYTYTVASANKEYSASGGSFTVDGAAVQKTAAFALVTYKVTFTETGLPSGTEWWVNITGQSALSSTGTTISTSLPNGSYVYTVATVDKQYSSSGGSFTVNGAAVPEPVTFSLVTYTVTFTETGLPLATEWWVNGTVVGSHSSTTTTISFSESNGSYTYTVASANKEYAVSGGSFAVIGAAAQRTVAFAPVTYEVTFTETGLPSATEWWVNVTGGASYSSTTPSIGFNDTNGTYEYTLGSANPSWSGLGGSFTVNGASVPEQVTFSLVTYPVTFIESGLPNGTEWWVNGTVVGSHTSTAPTIGFSEPNGSYWYTIGSQAGYTVRPNWGTVTVEGGPVSTTIVYAQPTIDLTPGQGPVGSVVTVSGANFSAASPVGLLFDSVSVASSGCTGGSLTTNATGTFTCVFMVPGGVSGTTVTATDVSGAYATAWFSVSTPSLVVSPNQGPVGATVTVAGHGFSVDTSVASLVFDGVTITSCLSGSLTTGTIAPGGFSCTFAVPSRTSGTTVTATDVGGAYATTKFTVTAPTVAISLGERIGAAQGFRDPANATSVVAVSRSFSFDSRPILVYINSR